MSRLHRLISYIYRVAVSFAFVNLILDNNNCIYPRKHNKTVYSVQPFLCFISPIHIPPFIKFNWCADGLYKLWTHS